LKKEMLTMLVQSRSGGKKGRSDNRVGAQHLRHESSTIFWNLVLYFELFGLPCEILIDEEEIYEIREAEDLLQQLQKEQQKESNDEEKVPILPPRPKDL
jgi:hypothetical protein